MRAAEVVMLAGVSQRVQTVADRAGSGVGSTGKGAQPLPGDALHTFVTLASPLAYCYRRDTAVLYGNVAAATHGETRVEVLGGGDPRVPRQAFRLRQPPLTWTSAPTTSGIESSLEVRVDDVTWHEAPGPGRWTPRPAGSSPGRTTPATPPSPSATACTARAFRAGSTMCAPSTGRASAGPATCGPGS
ncbi:hypothetical protein G7085_06885 [Tessaracoccus sp. HDW20]|uniref:hypothetical protein n=1 Tax=Tessaracoccus coleopterorum TaxID=2714950 RepID=UPI0018D29595|nr:hypothetical protein [Tessaracoccus coleopterorum]